MSAFSRNKGKSGERELALLLSELTGQPIKRRVRQYEADSDLEGLDGWAIECKRYAQASPAVIADWWHQCVTQAKRINATPILFYRLDRQDWCAMWPAHVHTSQAPNFELSRTLIASPSTWWQMQRNGVTP